MIKEKEVEEVKVEEVGSIKEESVAVKKVDGKVDEKVVKTYMKNITLAKINKEDFEITKKETDNKVKLDNRLTFEAFFEVLKLENSSIKDHHKRPIRLFLEEKNDSKMLLFKKERYMELFKNYF